MYIKINLLPADLRPKRTFIRFDPKALIVLAILVAFAGLGGWYSILLKEVHSRDAEFAKLKKEEAGLRETVTLRQEVGELRKKIVERVEIIRSLTADSDIRFDMLKHINGIIPENLWLLNINELAESDKIAFSIEGMSYTKKDISRFLEGLQRYKKFRNVALESISPSPQENRDVFQFIVRVELEKTALPEGPKSAEKKATPPAVPPPKKKG